jgi:hypothetical protein
LSGVPEKLEASFVAAATSLVRWQASSKPLLPWLSKFSEGVDAASQQSENLDNRTLDDIDAELLVSLLLKPPASADSAAALAAAQQVVTALDQLSQGLLQALPLATITCSNPGCINLRGSTELTLVAGRGLCGAAGQQGIAAEPASSRTGRHTSRSASLASLLRARSQ